LILSVGAVWLCACEVKSVGGTGTSGSGGDGGTGAASCTEGGVGTIAVETTGLPADAVLAVTLTGPGGDRAFTANESWADAASGDYTVTAERVVVDDPIVRTVYEPTITEEGFCLADGASHTVTVSYAPIPSSHKLWLTGGETASVLGFEADGLSASGEVPASVAADISAGGDVAFDRDGNLWTFGATTADPGLMRIPAAELGVSGEKRADRQINLAGIGCIPAMTGIAFDPDGNLWLASGCSDAVFRLPTTVLATSGDVTPDVILSNVEGPRGLAFDQSGNLWVTQSATRHLYRFDAARLSASTDTGPDRSILVTRDALDTAGFAVSWLAFDANGALWGNDFGSNQFFPVAPNDLMGTGEATVIAPVTITVSVTGLIDGMAFDESGGLWFGLHQGELARLSPAQLGVASGPGDPTTPETLVTSMDAGSIANVAFFPAPASLPLYHRYP
jgi:sugar lactone lactonase YvrE